LSRRPAWPLRIHDSSCIKPTQETQAAQAVGTRMDKIKDYLGAGGMAGDQEDA
jgi:hypothetical protein